MKRHTEFAFHLPALRIIENEHHLLKYLMDEWHEIVLHFERQSYTMDESYEAIINLRAKLIAFLEPLHLHMKKEEAFLFPLLANYIGNEQGPVLAVEEEHAEMTAYIDHFLH